MCRPHWQNHVQTHTQLTERKWNRIERMEFQKCRLWWFSRCITNSFGGLQLSCRFTPSVFSCCQDRRYKLATCSSTCSRKRRRRRVKTTDLILGFFACWFRTLEAHQHRHRGVGSLVFVFPFWAADGTLDGTESRTYPLSVDGVRDCVSRWRFIRGTVPLGSKS